MKATVDHHVVADSQDTIDFDGYAYFPASSVKTEWLEKTEKTKSDLA